MLVLMRHIGEQVIIGDDVIVTVTRAEGDKVWLGFSAPKEVVIDRSEVRERRIRGWTDGPAPAPEPEPGA